MRTIATLGMLLLLLATACGGSGSEDGTSGPTSTLVDDAAATSGPGAQSPFSLALDGIADDGTWSAETALAVFAAAFGPISGVEAPESTTDYRSGSAAIRMVSAKWAELSKHQQDEIAAYLGSSASALLPVNEGLTGRDAYVSALPPVSGLVHPAADPQYQDLADEAAAEIGAKIGHPLGIPIRLEIAESDRPDQAWAWAGGNFGEVPPGSKPTACVVNIAPSTPTSPDREPFLRFVLVHEVAHCFQHALLDGATIATSPAWIIEGQANWIAEAITDGQGQPALMVEYWDKYILDPGKTLYARSYDAVGFYAQLAHSEVDPWPILEPMVIAGSSDAAFQLAGATEKAFVDGWGSSWFRSTQPNRSWDMTTVYGIPDVTHRAAPQEMQIGDSGEATLSAVANAAAIGQVRSTAFITRIEVSGAGIIYSGRTGLERVIRAETVLYCTTPAEDCRCPPGSPNQEQPPERGPDDFRAAVTGELHNSSVMNLRGISKEEWCGRTPAPTPTATAPGPANSDCETLLPTSEVAAAAGVDIGAPTSIADFSVFPVACVWEATLWSLQGNPRTDRPVDANTYAGLPCARSGATDDVAYCLNSGGGGGLGGGSGAGGNITTRRWGLILTAPGLSLDQVEQGIVPILARTGR